MTDNEKRIFQWSQSNPKTFWALFLTCFLLLPLFVCSGFYWANPDNRITAEQRKQREEIKRKHDQWQTQEQPPPIPPKQATEKQWDDYAISVGAYPRAFTPEYLERVGQSAGLRFDDAFLRQWCAGRRRLIDR